MDETCEVKYRSRNNSSIVGGARSIIFFIIGIIALAGSSPYSYMLSLASFLFCFVGLWALLRDYEEIYLYSDRMEVVSNTDGLLGKVYYSDINRIGFLYGHVQALNTRGYDVKTFPAEVLVIMLKDGEEFKLYPNQYDHLHEVCSYIQEKIGQT